MSARKRVSIALATYRGERFLKEQLDSFAAQSRLPDELVVGDDSPDDATRAILEAFAATAPFPVTVISNQPALGPAANFSATFARCTGDVIFPSDQDDIWHPDKIGRMLAFMDEQPRVLVAVHDAALVDADARPLGLTMAGQITAAGDNPALGLVAGCCMAFDGRLARLYDPVPDADTHDAWLTSIADDLGIRGWLPEPLIHYRRHGSNVSQSYMSEPGAATRGAHLRERVATAWRRPVAAALNAAARAQGAALDALQHNASWLRPLAGCDRFDEAIRRRGTELDLTRRRLGIHQAGRAKGLCLILRAVASGAYRGQAGVLSFLRDLHGLARGGKTS